MLVKKRLFEHQIIGKYLLLTILNSVVCTCKICSFDIVMETEERKCCKICICYIIWICCSHTDPLNTPWKNWYYLYFCWPIKKVLINVLIVTLCAQSFVFGGRPVSTSSLRSTARAAVPEALELQTSMTTALEVSTPGWWANIVTVVVPCAILIILYLQSEKRKYEEKMGIKKWVAIFSRCFW